MLILTRSPGQTIMVGDDISITVLSTIDNQVRIGVTARKDIPIDREEIYLRKKTEAQNNPTQRDNR